MTKTLTYAIGDVHGRLDLLTEAARAIVRHAQGTSNRIVFLGDYVDRGPDSEGVVDFLIKASGLGAVCLKGNHEEMMVRAVRDRDEGEIGAWLANGGQATLRSYGAVTPAALDGLDRVPQAHLAWMEGLSSMAFDDHRIFVHAGLMPGVAVDQQDEDTCLWIRERFLRADAADLPAGKHVVHGHTPEWAGKPQADAPELLGHRTNLDTGAYATGVLSVGVFDNALAGGPTEVLRIVKGGA